MIKLTKNELRDQQYKLKQLEKYLPTLQLKKSLLQNEVNNAAYEIEKLSDVYLSQESFCKEFQLLLSDPDAPLIFEATRVEKVEKQYENIAGAEIPFFKSVTFFR